MGTATYSGYYQEPVAAFSGTMPQSALSYQSDYTQEARQAQNFGAYNTNLMYNVPQVSTQSSAYDNSQQFSSRQSAGLGMINAAVAAPYFPSQSADSGGAAAAALQSQAPPSSASAGVYQADPLQNYSTSMSGVGTMAQAPENPDVSMAESEYPVGTGGATEERWVEYQDALRRVFQNVINGNLESASESLLRLSNWLLTQVQDLGEL
jgi:hypothetical protein